MTVARLRTAGDPPASDAPLFRSMAGGDLGALGVLFDRHHARVRAFVVRAAPSADVDDLVQETFLAASRAADGYDGRDDGRPFLIGIAAQLVARRRRSFARLRAMLSRLGTANAEPVSETPEDLVGRQGDEAAVRAAVATLSDERRLALLLVEWEGLAGEDAARALGVPVGTLYRRVHEARAALKQALGRAGDPTRPRPIRGRSR